MAGRVRQCWDLVAAHPRPLIAVVLALYAPLYGLYALVVALGWLPEEAADKLFGLIGVLVLPFANGSIVWLVHHWCAGVEIPLGDALTAARQAWARLLTAYVSVSFILLGWWAITIVPLYLLMMLFKLQQPLLLVPAAAVATCFVLSRYAFLDPLVLVEGLGAYDARQRSAELARGRRRELIGWGLLVMGPPFVLETGGELLSDYLQKAMPGAVPLAVSTLSGFGSALLYVIPTVFFYLYYRSIVAAPAGPQVGASASADAAATGGNIIPLKTPSKRGNS